MTVTVPEKSLTQAIIQEMKTAGMRFYVHVPSSEHRPLFTQCGQDPFFRMVTACHEGDAVTIACGLSIAGKSCLVAIENAGLFQAAEALRAMAIDMQIPLVMLVGNQGSISLRPNVSPEEALDDLRARMGAAATHLQQQQRLAPRMLEVLGVPYAFMERCHWSPAFALGRKEGSRDSGTRGPLPQQDGLRECRDRSKKGLESHSGPPDRRDSRRLHELDLPLALFLRT